MGIGALSGGATAKDEQTDAMTLWVAERTLISYGFHEMATQINGIANEVAQGRLSRE